MAARDLPHDHGKRIGEVLDKMPEPEYFAGAAEMFAQLSDPSRLRIFWLLCHCEECGVNIAAGVGMSNAAVSHHLKMLRLQGLITSRRAGKEVYYSLAGGPKAEHIHRVVDELFEMTCPGKGLSGHPQEEK